MPRLSAPAAGLMTGLLVGAIDLAILLAYPPSRGTWTLPAWTWATVPWLWMTVGTFTGTLFSPRPLRRLAAVALVVIGPGILLMSRVATPLKDATGMSSKTIVLAWLAAMVVLAIPVLRVRFADARRTGLWLAASTISLALVICSALGLKASDVFSRTPTATSGNRNVVLVFLDTVRYDDARSSMPRLARFGASAVTFENAWAPSPWTVPSHFAVLSGVDPYRAPAEADAQLFKLSGKTLAERFRARGYATSAIFANPLLSEANDFTRGYDEHTVSRGSGVCRSAIGDLLSRLWLQDLPRAPLCGWFIAPDVTRRATRFIERTPRPYLLTLNYLDGHDPYYVRPECRDASFRLVRRAERQLVLGARPGRPVDPAVIARTRGQYREALQCLDRSLGELLDTLARDRDAATTTIVFVGDHGEHFGEHGLGSHGNSVYQPVLRVPLLVKIPGAAPARVTETMAIADIYPMLVQGRYTWRPVLANYKYYEYNEGAFTYAGDGLQYIRWDDGREALYGADGNELPLASRPAWVSVARDAVSRAKAAQLSTNEFRALGYLQ